MAKIKTASKPVAKTKTAKVAKTESSYEVQGEKCFYFCNGQVVSRLNDLPGVLRNIDEGTYGYHVNSERNDISAWVGDVFLKRDLSQKIQKSKNRTNMASVIEKELKH